MSYNFLPSDLFSAEKQCIISLEKININTQSLRLRIDFKFEGLKVEKVAIRLAKMLINKESQLLLAFPDFGSSSLAKRDYPELAKFIYTFKEISQVDFSNQNNLPILAISPQPYDYEDFLTISEQITTTLIMFNGKLIDSAVGIGSVGRGRRNSFIKSWKQVYYLETLDRGALLFDLLFKWQLFRYTKEGYIHLENFDSRPDDLLISTYI